jgi:hypothetical protein
VADLVGVIYCSAITTFGFGAGEIASYGTLIGWIACVEVFIGLFLVAYFTVAFARKILKKNFVMR